MSHGESRSHASYIERFLAAADCVNFSFPCQNPAINLDLYIMHIPFCNLNALCHHSTTKKHGSFFIFYIFIRIRAPVDFSLFSPLREIFRFCAKLPTFISRSAWFSLVVTPTESECHPELLRPCHRGEVVPVLRTWARLLLGSKAHYKLN